MKFIVFPLSWAPFQKGLRLIARFLNTRFVIELRLISIVRLIAILSETGGGGGGGYQMVIEIISIIIKIFWRRRVPIIKGFSQENDVFVYSDEMGITKVCLGIFSSKPYPMRDFSQKSPTRAAHPRIALHSEYPPPGLKRGRGD